MREYPETQNTKECKGNFGWRAKKDFKTLKLRTLIYWVKEVHLDVNVVGMVHQTDCVVPAVLVFVLWTGRQLKWRTLGGQCWGQWGNVGFFVVVSVYVNLIVIIKSMLTDRTLGREMNILYLSNFQPECVNKGSKFIEVAFPYQENMEIN